jgi:hypothetical protein
LASPRQFDPKKNSRRGDSHSQRQRPPERRAPPPGDRARLNGLDSREHGRHRLTSGTIGQVVLDLRRLMRRQRAIRPRRERFRVETRGGRLGRRAAEAASQQLLDRLIAI